MLRRDILFLVGIVLIGLAGLASLSSGNKSSKIMIVELDLWLFGLCGYLVLILLLEGLFPKFRDWCEKKI